MRAMTPTDATTSRPSPPANSPRRSWQRAVLWAGVPLCAAGMVQYRLWEQWHPGRFGELVLLSLLAWGLAWPLRRFAGWTWAAALVLPWCLALAWFAGALPVVATALMALAALALGSLLVARESAALQMTCGLIVLGAALSWLLPLPLHHRWSYLALCLVLIALRRGTLASTLRSLRREWNSAVSAAPVASAWTVLALGLASTGGWLPTMQPDDVGYHLRLPWELLEQGRYAMDPETHIWALAPWLGDVIQAFPQLISGAEARGPVNALWMLLTAAGVWQLGRTLAGDARSRWLSVALYASLPLTAVLAGSMQTETPTAAVLVWLAVLVLREPQAGRPLLRAGAILVGGLLALKLAAAATAILLLPWAAWRHRHALRLRPTLAATAVALVLGTSSYVYAWLLTGNPVLPLFNGYFRSAYFPASDFSDLRWNGGFDLLLPWKLTFDTGRYLEAFGGGGGFVFIALLGAWVLALLQRRTALTAVMLAALIMLPMIPMQYLRYAFPASVVLLPLLVVTAMHTHPRRAAWLLGGLCLLNFAFQSNGHWMLRTGALKEAVLAMGDDSASFRHYTPERILLARLRVEPSAGGNVLAIDPVLPSVAEMGPRARTVSAYDPSLAGAARSADADASGAAWAALLQRERITAVLSRKGTLTEVQRAGLLRADATMHDQSGDAQLWLLPAWEDAP